MFVERQVERGNCVIIDLQKLQTTVVVVELAVFGSVLPVNFITPLKMLVLKMDFIPFVRPLKDAIYFPFRFCKLLVLFLKL